MSADRCLKPDAAGGGGIEFDADSGRYVVSSLADARFILSSPDARFVRERSHGDEAGGNALEAFIERGRELSRLWMWGSPPETHRRLRRAAAEAVGAKTVAAHLDALRDKAGALLAEAGRREQADLVEEFARPLIRDLLLDMFGIPSGKRPQVEAHVQAMGDFLKGGELGIGPGHHFAVAATGQIIAEAWRAPLPAEATASRALLAAVEGGELSLDEAIAQAILLLLGNSYTTADALSGLIARLSERPDLWAAAREGRVAVGAMVEEGLRLGPPTHMVLSRRATGDLACPSGPIPAGGEIALPLCRINRDPAAFPDPDAFDPERRGGRPVAFGAGRHLCTGVHVARAALQVGLEALLHALPEWPSDVELRYGASLLGGTSLTAVRVKGAAIRCR